MEFGVKIPQTINRIISYEQIFLRMKKEIT